MPTEVLPIGMPWTMKALQVYALPPVAVHISADGATPSISFANTVEMTPNMTPVAVNGVFANAAFAFARSASDVLVVLKRA